MTGTLAPLGNEDAVSMSEILLAHPRQGAPVSADENTRLAQSAYEAFGRGDMAALAEVMTDDIEWLNPGDPAHDPNAGTFNGKEAVLGWFGGLASTLDFTRFEPQDFIAQNDKVVSTGVRRGNGSGHRPRVCQSRGTRVDVPGWEGRPIPGLPGHRRDGCRPPRGVAPRRGTGSGCTDICRHAEDSPRGAADLATPPDSSSRSTSCPWSNLGPAGGREFGDQLAV